MSGPQYCYSKTSLPIFPITAIGQLPNRQIRQALKQAPIDIGETGTVHTVGGPSFGGISDSDVYPDPIDSKVPKECVTLVQDGYPTHSSRCFFDGSRDIPFESDTHSPAITAFRSSFIEALKPWLRAELVLATMILTYMVVFGKLTWLQQSNYGTFDFDLGVFDQEIWLAAHHWNALITIRGTDMWANHVNPVVYLLVPFYWIGAGSHFLLLVQTFAFAIAAVPLWQLTNDRISDPWWALVVPFAWLLYPAVQWMTSWPFQPEYLAVPALIWAYWFADKHRWVWYWIAVALVLATKEDAALPIIALGILLAARRQTKVGALTCSVAIAWFLICIKVIMPAAAGGAAPFFASQFPTLGSSFGQMLYNSVRHPSLILSPIFANIRFHYYF